MSQQDSNYKYFGLLLLTVQQASMPLMARYSRSREESQVFLTTVNVFMMEVIKLVVCSTIILYTNRSILKFMNELHSAIIANPLETLKVCVPAIIYTLQNNLYYVALSHLEATTFCIAYQMKIFTTAIFMYFFLGKKLSRMQWMALLLLVIGVADVQLVYSPPPLSEKVIQKPWVGFLSVLTMCFTSAFAGVYLEKVLKESRASVWVQNVRLSLIGLPIAFVSMWLYDWDNILEPAIFSWFFFGSGLSCPVASGAECVTPKKDTPCECALRRTAASALFVHGLHVCAYIVVQKLFFFLRTSLLILTLEKQDGAFRGWDVLVASLTLTNSMGGLLISIVIKYADNILKAYAQSMAIIGAAVGSWLLFDFTPGFFFLFGTTMVICSIIMYTMFPYVKQNNTYSPLNTKPDTLLIIKPVDIKPSNV
ncbi:unnamed protein product [Caenorhabditis auriculariae]|uniref:Uncharacterized protein n=1 Tax=Caenorhabditis auriculariae TaxID=2777116 RepID=A0A8S1HF40_9PELO|nr:unnamed protein product [Caenorhabditis auriculariae]